MCSLHYSLRMIKARKIMGAGGVERMGEATKACHALV
jgi:hypothetical protein